MIFEPNEYFRKVLEETKSKNVARMAVYQIINSIADSARQIQYQALCDAWTDRGEEQ